jgi:hypothetical protein
MTQATFLTNARLWQTVAKRIKTDARIAAAIAYVGKGGAKLLPLKNGDTLVVDMSLATVRNGTTDPREIEKFLERGVNVFSRRYLHSKLLVADRFAIIGSANVSTRSRDVLDEAAVLTNDAVVIRRAKQFINQLATEPVRREYLKECKRAYRPPRMNGAAQQRAPYERIKHAKLWIVPLQTGFTIPESELPRYERGTAQVKKLVTDSSGSRVDNFFWPYRPRMADELERGDWIIQTTKEADGSIWVQPPAQLLLIDSYVRDKKTGKERYVFHIETPKGGQAMSWSSFRKRARTALKSDLARRTKAVRDGDQADILLRLWTARGRLAKA